MCLAGSTWVRMLPPDIQSAMQSSYRFLVNLLRQTSPPQRSSILDTLASMETAEEDVNKAFITGVECSMAAHV